jgi:hypothetical protein
MKEKRLEEVLSIEPHKFVQIIEKLNQPIMLNAVTKEKE